MVSALFIPLLLIILPANSLFFGSKQLCDLFSSSSVLDVTDAVRMTV